MCACTTSALCTTEGQIVTNAVENLPQNIFQEIGGLNQLLVELWCWDLIGVALADKDTNLCKVMKATGQSWIIILLIWQCKWCHLVAKCVTHASNATWWPSLQLMQVVPSGVICNQSKCFFASRNVLKLCFGLVMVNLSFFVTTCSSSPIFWNPEKSRVSNKLIESTKLSEQHPVFTSAAIRQKSVVKIL